MCNRLPEINKNGDAGIFPVYYSLNENYRKMGAGNNFRNTIESRLGIYPAE